MPESACLHIQARDADPIRVVEIPGASVRIGRASYCEVRLPEPEVADEECLLRRRGGTWHLVPVARTGQVRIDDRAVERPMPIAYGMSFRVGGHQLTLQETGDAPGRWGSFQRPIPLEVPSVESTPVERVAEDGPSRESPRPEPEPGPAGFEDEQERLSRWQARQEQRESWLKTRQEERRWEERWKAAGERLRARSATPPPRPAPAPAPVFKANESGERVTTSMRDGVRVRKMPRRSVPVTTPSTSDWGAIPIPPRAEPLSTHVVPVRDFRADRPPEIDRTGLDVPSSAEDETTRDEPANTVPEPAELAGVSNPETAEPTVESDSVGPAVPAVSEFIEPKAGIVRPTILQALREQIISVLGGRGQAERAPEVLSAEPRPTPTGPGHPDAITETEPVSKPPQSEEAFEATPAASEPPVVPDPIAERFETSTVVGWDALSLFSTDTIQAEPAASIVPDPVAIATPSVKGAGEPASRPRPGGGRSKRIAARPAAPGTKRAESPRTTRSAAPASAPVPARSASVETSNTRRDWPTAREIFAAQQARRDQEASPTPSPSRTTRAQPMPTQAQEPAGWSVPLWLGWPPALVVFLGVGGLVLALTVVWSGDDQMAGQVANHLARSKAKGKPLPETWVPPAHPTWWNTTSGNLARWALARDRTAHEPGDAEEVRALLDAATGVSPVNASARFALARAVPPEQGTVLLSQSLSLSRDVVALAWSGRQLLAAGKKEPALKTYRAALEIAARAEPSRLAPPAFLDDSQTRRYALPSEELIGAVVRDLAERTDWQFADWAEALPRFGVAPLVAARIFRERASRDADTALDILLASADAPPPEGVPVAVHLAAVGEALALKSRWAEAEERYRKAIDLMPDDRICRSWHFNLADLALRLDDEPKRLRALEAAKGADSKDEITQRVLDLLKYTGVRSLPSGSRTADASTRNGAK